MRLYTFCHFMLSSIQQGIQSAHVVHELFVTHPYPYPAEGTNAAVVKHGTLLRWATHHKTMIVLNGGNSGGLLAARQALVNFSDLLSLPMASFYEDGESLEGALTCVGIVVPDSVYELDLSIGSESPTTLKGTYRYQLAQYLAQFKLAR